MTSVDSSEGAKALTDGIVRSFNTTHRHRESSARAKYYGQERMQALSGSDTLFVRPACTQQVRRGVLQMPTVRSDSDRAPILARRSPVVVDLPSGHGGSDEELVVCACHNRDRPCSRFRRGLSLS